VKLKNWKLYLESTNELDLVKDIITEIEDNFEISIQYDNTSSFWFCVIDIQNINVDPSKNDDIVKFIVKICQKIEEMTEQKCEFKLIFKPIPKVRALSGPLGKVNISNEYVVLYGPDDGVEYDYGKNKSERKISDFKFEDGTIWINEELRGFHLFSYISR
jgi:hypothetical protein